MNKLIIVLRWIGALLLLPVLTYLIYLFFAYPFEWLMSISTKWGLFWHVVFWLFIGYGAVQITTIIANLIALAATFLVKQSPIYSALLFLSLFALVIFSLKGAWSNDLVFSWRLLPYPTFNKILYTLLIGNTLSAPWNLLLLHFSKQNN